MPLLTTRPPAGGGRTAAPRRRTRLLALPEARWAAAALALFLTALPLDLLGAPAWTWGPLYALAYASGGWEPALEGLKALREKRLDVDLLMVAAALGAAAIGQVLDGALLIVIFATSGALEAIATARTADSVRGLLDLAPQRAVRLAADGAEEPVAAAELRIGDTVLVRPGERVGADGRVTDGASEVDQAAVTGEPLPAVKEIGDTVFAGTLNGTGHLRVAVERDPADTVIARIAAMVDDASRTKAATQLFIERVEQRYSVGMVAATLALFTVPLLWGAALEPTLLRAMTFMIVASPCALVLATMPPMLAAIANAGRHGVLVKSARALERLARSDRAALDKTGTLTEGAPRVSDILPLTDDFAAEEVLALAAAAEHPSEHPLARAVVAAARERGVAVETAADFSAAVGRGVRAVVAGRDVAVGAPQRLVDDAAPGAARARSGAAALEDTGKTAVVVLADGRPVGLLGVADRMRPGAADAVARLRALTGTEPVLLTGDNPRAAELVAAQAGIGEARSGLLPEDKVAAVHGFEEAGHRVLMVGDGINDAPALAAAHTSIAMGRAGSDLALETADAVVVGDDLAAVPTALSLARRARRLVAQNLVIAAVFIAGLVAWDLAGTLPLPLAVAGHEGSTVLVALNGLRLLGEGAWRRAQADE
ncbi:heavy metal translocating P-type ATPase [Streptomonospora litoralis]|uniref:Putative cation-transporting P-type ATPase J n=1 Tax=Streptomonospora litoralis TaxID=2498135 RepID=A0A4P6Q735_9ACTN|nr:heavy metal translocating P-type ATPase [Streptomonospora litoralis]QBI54899.1 putative cation-transporting P-type ATPase J [Streptomonospora litoralis]